jgi:predicted RecB family nuclease
MDAKPKAITTDMVVAFHQCERKTYFLINGEERLFLHEYDRVIKKRAAENRKGHIIGKGHSISPMVVGSISCPNGVVSEEDIEAECDLLCPNRNNHNLLEPLIAVGTQTATVEQKLALALAGYVVGRTHRVRPSHGFVLSYKGKLQRIKLEFAGARIEESLKCLREQQQVEESAPPKVDLNEHCERCLFRPKCRGEAEEQDDLSLLERMTPKLIRKYHNQGIFTVNQLSYKYRPRRSRKKPSSAPTKFKLELQALALRTGNTYLVRAPEIPDEPTEIFLDIEGIPEEGFDYLIGLQVSSGGTLTAHSFWADSNGDELGIFHNFLNTVRQYKDAPIFHYGSYDSRSLNRMSKHHGLDIADIERRLVNISQFVYGQVYFPTRSNGLKTLGTVVGATWESTVQSGLESLAWRYLWEDSVDRQDLKEDLIDYNQCDCRAVRLLTTTLRDIGQECESRIDVEFADSPKEHSTAQGEDLHRSFEKIIQSAHTNYRRGKIRIGQSFLNPGKTGRKPGGVIGHPGYMRNTPKSPGRVVTVRRKLKCPRCVNSGLDLERLDEVADRTIIDLVFTKSGCRKTVTKYVGNKSRCNKCKKIYFPPYILRLGTRVFGHGFKSWAVYQRVVLRLPYSAITCTVEDLFSEIISQGAVVNFITQFSSYYASTERTILKQILTGSYIHIDETKISIKGATHFVWVLTNGTHVVFRLTETREACQVKELLHGYEGVVITDFFGGYDGMETIQQKCIVHLVRDLNEDLWKNPYNSELEEFIESVRSLMEPIFKDVEKYGLRARNLRKHTRAVDKFYKSVIDCGNSKCDLVAKYQKRFTRYRGSIFTFLEHDGIPWHNNTAERAIRHLAVQRKISGQFSQNTAGDYLRLLGIAQTCRFQEKSFLRFLCSGEKNIDSYKERTRRKPTQPVHK